MESTTQTRIYDFKNTWAVHAEKTDDDITFGLIGFDPMGTFLKMIGCKFGKYDNQPHHQEPGD